MHLRFFLLFLSLFTAYSSLAAGVISPVGALRIGENWTQWGNTQNVEIIDGFVPDRFIADEDTQTNIGGGGFVGAEWHSAETPWRFQAGLSYDYLSSVNIRGDILEFGDSSLNDLSYEYAIQHQRVDGEFKILRKINKWYPYVTGALGIAWNKSKGYKETSSGDEVPRTGKILNENNTQRDFTWSAGAGIERSFGSSWRVGLGYLFTDAGKAAQLNTTDGAVSLETENLYINQALLQVSYILCSLCTSEK